MDPRMAGRNGNPAAMRNDTAITKIGGAIERALGNSAQFLYAIRVHDKQDGKTTWYGKIYVYFVEHNRQKTIAYAWFNITNTGPDDFRQVEADILEETGAAVTLTLFPNF